MIGNLHRSIEFPRRHRRHSSLLASNDSAKYGIRWKLSAEPFARKLSAARVPSQERLFRIYGSALTSFLASQGMGFEEGERTFQARARAFLASRCKNVLGIEFKDWIAQVVAVKVKRHNTGVSVPSEEEESATSDAVDRNATAYFKASRGE